MISVCICCMWKQVNRIKITAKCDRTYDLVNSRN